MQLPWTIWSLPITHMDYTMGLLFYHPPVRLGSPWIKRREVMTGARRIRSEKLREHQIWRDKLGVLSVR